MRKCSVISKKERIFQMKKFSILALVLAVLLCFTACANQQAGTSDSASEKEPLPTNLPEEVVTRPKNEIPEPITDQEPTEEGETYRATGGYIGMADNNIIAVYGIESEGDSPKEQYYQLSPEIDLDAMGIIEGSVINLEYTVDANGVKRVQSVAVAY